MSIDFTALAAPFDVADIEWRVGNHTRDKQKATLLPYLTSRAVMKRLDEVAGPARWRDSYVPTTGGKQTGFLCTLEIEVEPGVWVGKTDAADTTDIESIKGGVSDALKRAAVKWGIGRYLYDLPDARFQPIQDGYPPNDDDFVFCPKGEDRKPGHIRIPRLPAWALPAGGGKQRQEPRQEPKAEQPRQQGRAEASDTRKQSAADDHADQQIDRGAGRDPKPQPTERAVRLKTRIERIEKTMSRDDVARVRNEQRVPVHSDLVDLPETTLEAYGKALVAASKAAA